MNINYLSLFAILLLFALSVPTKAQETKQLKEFVIIAGKQKHKKLLGTGVKIPCGASSLSAHNTGIEIGSIIETKHPFEIEEISFGILSNNLKGVMLEVEIYRTDSCFTKVLPYPIRINVPTGEKQQFVVSPNEQTIIEPGEYFVAVRFEKCNKEECNSPQNKQNNILFPLYLKRSYIRNGSNQPLEKNKVNLGLKVKGIEYR